MPKPECFSKTSFSFPNFVDDLQFMNSPECLLLMFCLTMQAFLSCLDSSYLASMIPIASQKQEKIL